MLDHGSAKSGQLMGTAAMIDREAHDVAFSHD